MNNIPPTPEYHKKVMHNVVWDKTFHYPAIVCDISDLTPEALKTYKVSKLSTKIPIINIVTLRDIEPFSYETIFKHKRYQHTETELEKFQSAVTTAFYYKEVHKDDDSSIDARNLNEYSSGCCDCLNNNTDDELYSYVFCDKCLLAYHYKCEGFEKVPADADSDDYRYVCKRCKEYLSNHSEKEDEENVEVKNEAVQNNQENEEDENEENVIVKNEIVENNEEINEEDDEENVEVKNENVKNEEEDDNENDEEDDNENEEVNEDDDNDNEERDENENDEQEDDEEEEEEDDDKVEIRKTKHHKEYIIKLKRRSEDDDEDDDEHIENRRSKKRKIMLSIKVYEE